MAQPQDPYLKIAGCGEGYAERLMAEGVKVGRSVSVKDARKGVQTKSFDCVANYHQHLTCIFHKHNEKTQKIVFFTELHRHSLTVREQSHLQLIIQHSVLINL